MTIEEANRLLIASLNEIFDERESASICSLVMEKVSGMTKSLRVMHKTNGLTAQQQIIFQQFLSELIHNRPVQYVLGEAWFGGLPFYVDENVLIPRPETEELADWLVKESISEKELSLLDIGTGSGCIPVYIKNRRPDFRVMGLDMSEPALEIAKMNSRINQTPVEFYLGDIRDPIQQKKLPPADLMISNPPYIPEKQKLFLEKHVKDFEPSLALFVPDEDPIIFYKTIGAFAINKLLNGGLLFLEIHHDFAMEIMTWYEQNGFSIELRKDLSGNNRMIKAWRNNRRE